MQISVELIKYIKHYMQIDVKTDPKRRFSENVNSLFEQVQNYFGSIWTALGGLLSKEINENKAENSYKIEAIELIEFCLNDLKGYFFKAQ